MSTIKVVQIALAASLDDTWSEQYLDDKGRVWMCNWSSGKPQWTQLDLPEEPQS